MNIVYQDSGLGNLSIQSPKRGLGRSFKIAVPLVGLAAILAVFTQTEVGKSTRRFISGYVGNVIDNAIYGRDVTSQRYILTTYEIKPGDDFDTLKDKIGSNEMAHDYVIIANPHVDPVNLKPGIIKIPIHSNQGKTLPELFDELK